MFCIAMASRPFQEQEKDHELVRQVHKLQCVMGQNRVTGAAGDKRGREDSRIFAKAIDATMISSRSNDAIRSGKNITIRSAKSGTGSVGCYLHVLDRVEEVYAAFEESPGSFCILMMSAETFRGKMTLKDSVKGANGQVSRSDFYEFGHTVQRNVPNKAEND